MALGLLMPGRRCDLCGALLLFAAVATPLGGMFCVSHRDLPNCQLCSAPFRGSRRFCDICGASCVNTHEHVRSALPRVRGVIQAMGIRLEPPVHVRLVDPAQMPAVDAREWGLVVGVTTMKGREVTQVYIATGLPELEFGSTIAHECMHAWMAQNGFPRLAPEIDEGLCQVVAYRFLRDQPDPRAALLRQRIDRDPDPIYGDGFRAVKESVRRHGMNPGLDAVRATSRLP